VREDTPANLADFDAWVIRTVLNPQTPLFREVRYLLAEKTEIRDPSLYHSVLAAVAEGNATPGIAEPLITFYQAIMSRDWARFRGLRRGGRVPPSAGIGAGRRVKARKGHT
jgi:hypothetical protein